MKKIRALKLVTGSLLLGLIAWSCGNSKKTEPQKKCYDYSPAADSIAIVKAREDSLKKADSIKQADSLKKSSVKPVRVKKINKVGPPPVIDCYKVVAPKDSE